MYTTSLHVHHFPSRSQCLPTNDFYTSHIRTLHTLSHYQPPHLPHYNFHTSHTTTSTPPTLQLPHLPHYNFHTSHTTTLHYNPPTTSLAHTPTWYLVTLLHTTIHIHVETRYTLGHQGVARNMRGRGGHMRGREVT